MNQDATLLQRQATMPALSAWVTANAGSGKTHVLVNRIARLLLSGSAPDRLLCLTFTKAAAAEMSVRLFEQLGRWTLMSDDDLQQALYRLSGEAPDDNMVARARRLFAEALESPGGLRIQTIHSFCQGLLKRFPLESGVAPAFTVLDDLATDELLREARDRVLRDGIAGDAELMKSVRALTAFAGEERFDGLVRQVINERGMVQPFLDKWGRHGIAAGLRSALGIGVHADEDSLLRDAMLSVPASLAGSIANSLVRGAATDQKKAVAFKSYAENPDPARLQVLLESLLTQKGEILKTFPTKTLLKAAPEVEEPLRKIAELARSVRQGCNALRIAEHTGNLLLLAGEILRVYRELKVFHAALDYDDLIARAAALFESPGAQWVLYKLDGGIDHVLIDEAQDTSPSQWAVVRAIATEFFSGVGADRPWQALQRTVFAVGDIKQSIMSFQGARPVEFIHSQKLISELAKGGGHATFEHVRLTHSFRSAPAILGLVDEVFSDKDVADGVLIGEVAEPHRANRSDMPGLVELWPLQAPVDAADPLAWDAPRDRVSESDPAVVLAQRIAQRIKSWVAERVLVHDKEDKVLRPMTPGDVMILVRRRGLLSSEVIRQLKRLGIPVAGADRLVLAEHIAVMDLIALGRFALMPHDDLTLATVLRGPCCGVSEEDLFSLAHGRGKSVRLWSVLQQRASDPKWASVHAFLHRLHDMADHLQPYEFYSMILGPMGGWTRMMGRLGLDAADPMEEFMSAALDFGRTHTPSLEAFLHLVERADTEIKRDQDRSEGAVRVLTVHGSKGLEAPIVILPDSYSTPEHGRHDDELLETEHAPLWKIESDWDEDVRRAARQRGREERMREYRRLLYVALTRPRDQLHVCGYLPRKKSGSERNWYDIVASAMQRLKATPFADASGGEGLRFGAVPGCASEVTGATVARPLVLSAALPDWALRSAAEEREETEILASERVKRSLSLQYASGARMPAMDFGSAVHGALEAIADAPPELWGPRAREVARVHASAGEISAIVEEVLRVRENPAFASLFGPGSFGEVGLRGRVSWQGRRFRFPGRLDRVVVQDDGVLVVEFKTDRFVPAEPSGIRPGYLRQLALYRRALEGLFPGKPVSCGILWTVSPRLMLVPPALIQANEGVLDPVGTGS
jgi:ATP-dependent helicase/nuclease subunit A